MKKTIREYFTYLRKDKKAATIMRYKSAVKKAVLNAAGQGISLETVVRIDIIFKSIKTGTPVQKIQPQEILSVDDINHIIKHAGHKTALIIRALYMTACRVSELAGIRLRDCEVRGDIVYIRVVGKKLKERYVLMRTEVFEVLKKAYMGETYLLETATGRHIHPDTIYLMVREAGRKAGFGWIHPHTLRHSFATNRLAHMGIDKVSAYLGHASPETTAKCYLHNQPTDYGYL